MKLLLLLAACCLVQATHAHDCDDLDRLKVKTQWVKVYGHEAQDREQFGHELWGYLFEHFPKVKDMLSRVRADNLYSPEFNAHAVRVFGGFDICVSLLDDELTLNAQLEHLRDQHNDRGIPHEYFDYFWIALVHAIPQHVEHFDQDAWEGCYNVIKAGITKDLTVK